MIHLLKNNKKTVIFIIIILVAFIQRGATLFVEFYDVDELTDVIMTSEIVEGGKLYIDAIPGRPVYFAFFYTIFKAFGSYNIIALHFFTIIWIIATSYVIYRIARELFHEEAGYFAALFYVIFVSGFFEYYLAVHGEIIYNLPVSLSFYFFILAEKEEKAYLHYFLAGVFAGISILTKGQTLLLPVYFFVYLVFVKSIVSKQLLINIRRGLLIFSGFVTLLLVFSYIIYQMGVLDNFITFYWSGGIHYTLHGFSQADLMERFFPKIGQNSLAQAPLWLLFFYYLIHEKWLKTRETNHSMILLFFGISFLGIFMGGSRFYNHYFLQYLPALCVIAGYGIVLFVNRWIERKRIIQFANIIIYLSVIVYSTWNYTIAYNAHYNIENTKPFNHGVIARKEYKEVSEWIKANSRPTDRIVQWGDCIEIYYFSQRRPGMRFIWASLYTNFAADSNKTSSATKFSPEKLASRKKLSEKKQWSFNTQEDIEYSIIIDLDNKKPRYIIDTAPSNFRGFGKYPLEKFYILYDYIKRKYQYKRTLDKMKIYEIIPSDK
ncbi:MAG: hypothetical protein IEMM0008_0041 [bacterium]|nr:MAG: hypothetical protein IEMM0008_0041 [bacterium]